MAGSKYGPFKLWILVIAWIFQLLFLLFALGLYILVTLAISGSPAGGITTDVVVRIEIALSGVSIVLILAEIILCATYNLSPLFYLFSNVIKSAIWIGLTAATLVINHYYDGDSWNGVAYNGIGIGISAALVLVSLLPVIYAAILCHQKRTRETDMSEYIHSVYNNPSDYQSTRYQGASVPHPGSVYLEDGQRNEFLNEAKSRSGRMLRKEVAWNDHPQSLMVKVPESIVNA